VVGVPGLQKPVSKGQEAVVGVASSQGRSRPDPRFHRKVLGPEVSGCAFGDASPGQASRARPRRNAAHGDSPAAERNPGSPHPTTPRPNGANGDHTHPVPCALSGHKGRCVAWSPGFHPGLSPVAPSGHGHGTRRPSHGVPSSQKPGIWQLETGNFPHTVAHPHQRRVRAPGLQSPPHSKLEPGNGSSFNRRCRRCRR
jgi:hypothetical protein